MDSKNTADLLSKCRELNVSTVPLIDCTIKNLHKQKTNHIVLLAATQPGLKNLYKLVSYSNLDHFIRHRVFRAVFSTCTARVL